MPLDLETFILVTKDNKENIETLDDLSIFFEPHRYTLGMSFEPKNNLAKFLNYNNNGKSTNYDDISYELTLKLLSDISKNLNKNLLSSNFLEIYNSFEMNENVYLLFNDGVILNKSFSDKSFQLFPQKFYQWDQEKGVFSETDKTIPYSYFGFSAYINNQNNFGFICHLIDPNVRKNTFRNFNISIGPLSHFEVKSLKIYQMDILNYLKIKINIVEINEIKFSENFNLIKYFVR